jgi:hypothetical protein
MFVLGGGWEISNYKMQNFMIPFKQLKLNYNLIIQFNELIPNSNKLEWEFIIYEYVMTLGCE